MYKYVEPRFDEDGNISPEARLPPACVGGFFIPVCLFWFGWSAQPYIHWIMPVFGSMLFAIGTFLLFNAVLSWLPDAYPAYAASVLAGNDLFRSSFGAGFPLFATAMYHNLGVGWASSTLAFISIVFIPIPWVLMKVGFLCWTDFLSVYGRADEIVWRDAEEEVFSPFSEGYMILSSGVHRHLYRLACQHLAIVVLPAVFFRLAFHPALLIPRAVFHPCITRQTHVLAYPCSPSSALPTVHCPTARTESSLTM